MGYFGECWEVLDSSLPVGFSSFAVGSVGLSIRISTNRFSADVRTSVVVGSLAGCGNQRMYSRIEMLGAMLKSQSEEIDNANES